jgi:acetolactate synthase I/II/III large subunit
MMPRGGRRRSAPAPPLAGGLGLALGQALGAKLTARERLVVATVGDGSYMFGNPTPFHLVARGQR